jgi:hypothetical protein
LSAVFRNRENGTAVFLVDFDIRGRQPVDPDGVRCRIEVGDDIVLPIIPSDDDVGRMFVDIGGASIGPEAFIAGQVVEPECGQFVGRR